MKEIVVSGIIGFIIGTSISTVLQLIIFKHYLDKNDLW